MGLGTGAVLAGCTESDDDDGGDDTETDSAPTDDQYGGTLAVTTGTHPESINPLFHVDGAGYIVTHWTYSNLTLMVPNADGELELVSDLATDWEADNDAQQWNFMLRDDATFQHSGNSVLAEDVKATVDTVYDPDLDLPGFGELGPIETVDVVNDHEVQINLSEPDAEIPERFGTMWGSILPKNIVEDDIEAPDTDTYGSGPFDLVERDIGSLVVVESNDDYYLTDQDGNQLPYLDTVELHTVQEASTEVSMLEGGESHIINEVRPRDFERLDDSPDTEAIQIPSGNHAPIVMMPIMEPFASSPELMHAFKYAVDKQLMLDIVEEGFGEIAQNHPVSPAHDLFMEIEDPFGDEPLIEEAENALAEAGFEGGFDYSDEYGPIFAPEEFVPPAPDIATVFQENLEQINVDLEIEVISFDRFVNEVGNHPMYINTYSMRPTELTTLFTTYHSDGGLNHGHFAEENQSEMDTLIEEARATVDQDERQEKIRDCLDYLMEHSAMIIPYFTNRFGATQPDVSNYNMDPTATSIRADEVWFEE